MKAWETIRLLLACQHAHERLAKISSMRDVHHGRLADLKSTMESMSVEIQSLEAEITSICADEDAKEAEITDLQERKIKLNAELVNVKSNARYLEINRGIDRYNQNIDALETAELEILENKEVKIRELEAMRKTQQELSQQHDKEEQKIQNVLDALDADEVQEKENLKKLEREFPAKDESLKHFRNLVKKGRLNAIVEVVQEACPGCQLEICTSLLQEACFLDHVVKCEFCDRIIFSTVGATLLCISDTDIEHGRLPLPPRLALRGEKTTRIRDVWGNWHEAKIAGDWLTGLKSLFVVHALSPGEQVKLIKGDSEDVLRFEPEMVTRQELDSIVNYIESSGEPLILDSVIVGLLGKKVRVYRLQLLSSKVRLELEKIDGIYFRGNLVWHRPLAELQKPEQIPPPLAFPREISHEPLQLPNETSITLDAEAVEIGVFPLRREFRTYFADVNPGETVTLLFGVSEEFEVEFDATTQALKGQALQKWYQSNGLEPGDRVTLTARDGERRTFHIHTEWKRDLNRLLEQAREGTLSCSDRPRDLLYGLLVEANRALHYRDLWSRANEFCNLRIGNVISTLSRYNRRLFCCVGGGCWGLAEWPNEKLQKERQKSSKTSVFSELSYPDEHAIWKAINEIEKHDLVYKLLKRAGSDLSFSDIARQLAEMLSVNVEHLTETSFLNVRDERLQRLANGGWTLKEFIKQGPAVIESLTPSHQETVPVLEESRISVPHSRWHLYIPAALIGVAALVWLIWKK